MRICVLSERMAPPFDEGIKNYALHLARALRAEHDVLALTTLGRSAPELGVRNVPANRLLLSLPLMRALRGFDADLVIYIPTACATLFSSLRTHLLSIHAQGAPVVEVALQVRRYGELSRLFMPLVQPDLVLVQSERTRGLLEGLGYRTTFSTPGVDTDRFRPVDGATGDALRRRYGIPSDSYAILHVGHLRRERNVQALSALQHGDGNQVIVVGSSSTRQERALVGELIQAGVHVIDEYISDIAQVYQMADCYVFPTRSEMSAIDVPLSVLEAMACDLCVVTTPFGGLPALFEGGPGFRYVEGAAEMPQAVAACKRVERPGTREMVAPYTWSRAARRTLQTICETLELEKACDKQLVSLGES
jgi:glycosyltransferase involved in cell wall biosynthesis